MRANGSMKSLEGRPDSAYFLELNRVSCEQIIWGANNFQLPQFKGFIVWEKETITENFTMSMAEIASLSEGLSTVSKIYKQRPQDKFRIHPTQKPEKLYGWIFHHYAKPEHRILDTHLGSGSSAIAAHYFGCEFVGIELDEDYFDAACRRIEQATKQTALF
jgi:site-specific DNA-methyltransferase (adenine-specific)